MTYEKGSAYHLRTRGMSESQISDVISEVRAHTTDDVSAESEFGTPEEYASSFPKSKRRTRGVRVITAAVIIAFAYGVAVVVLAVVFKFDIRVITGPVTLWPGSLIIVLGVLGGFLIDHLRHAAALGSCVADVAHGRNCRLQYLPVGDHAAPDLCVVP